MAKLALLGGTPIRTKPFPLWPQASKKEKKYLNEVIESSGWGVFRGSRTFELEEKFAAYHGANFGIACSNGTVALQVQLQCQGIGRGDEVVTTVFTCVSTVAAILAVGAIPIFVDIDPASYCMDVSKVESKITPKTKAIVAVHLYNSVCDLSLLTSIVSRYRLILIEDAAQIPGTFFNGKGIGTFGDSGSFSFQESKIMSAGEGGMIITNEREVAELANAYVNSGRLKSNSKTKRRVLGSNYRMTDFQAALLLGQLETLDQKNDKRERSVQHLNSKLREIRGIEVIDRIRGVTKQACYYYVFKILPELINLDRKIFCEAMEAEGVPTRNIFVPLYKDPLLNLNLYDTPEAFEYYSKNPLSERDFPVAEKAAFSEAIGIWHPFLLLDHEDLADLVRSVEKIIENAVELAELSNTKNRQNL